MAVLQIHNLIFCSILTLVQSLKWTHHVILDRDRMFHLSWTPLDETIQFEMQVRNIITQCGNVRNFFFYNSCFLREIKCGKLVDRQSPKKMLF